MPAPSDLIHETATSTGTGNFTLVAVNGKRTFNTGFGTGGTDLFDYYISSRDAAEWERGTGHMSDATTLVRDTVLASSNAGAAVNFAAGTKDVTNDIPAANHVFNENSTVTDGHAVLFDGTTGRKLKSAGSAPYVAGGTDVAVADGGTGASTLTNHGVVIGQGTSAVAVTATGTAGQILTSGGASADPAYANNNSTITFIIDGGGQVITTGIKGDLEIPFGCVIQSWTALADQSGSIVIDIWKDTYANYPPTVADTITASAKPTISTATKGQSSTLTGWTTSITAGDTLRFNVDSITTCTRVTLSLLVFKT